MLTISSLAKRFSISRSTILYYEKEGLLTPAQRSSNNYRWYGNIEISRLQNIIAYRAFGLSVSDIRQLLDSSNDSREQCLRAQFQHLEQEVNKLRRQQLSIVRFLKQPELLEEKVINKDKWVEIMRASGLNDEDMNNWHREFEKLEPDAHEEFLQSLGISAEEISKIRARARQEA